MMAENPRKVFISYSWAVQQRVIELAERLIANGIDVVLDVWDLKPGHDKYAFMEQSVNDPSVDKVLIICDKTYTEKADARQGGVGDETVIISPEVYGKMDQEKFIPIAFEADEDGKAYIPHYLKSRIYFDLITENDRYEAEYEKLLRNIYEKPMYRKPALGKKPEWLENDVVDLSAIRDIIKQIKGNKSSDPGKVSFLLRKASDLIVETAKMFVLPDNKPEDEGLLIAIDQTIGFRNIFVSFLESLLYADLPFAANLAPLFERLYNELHTVQQSSEKGTVCMDLYKFLIWELFICMTAVLLHYEKYADLHDMLEHTYFLKRDIYNRYIEPKRYNQFESYSRIIEEQCKPKSSEPRRLTMQGDILVHREFKPLLTKESLSNADLVLYQLGQIFLPEGSPPIYWFPTTYIYLEGVQDLWIRLKSKEFCNKVFPLFGVDSIANLCEKVKLSINDSRMRYSNSFDYAPGILNWIQLNEIGLLP